MSANLSASSIVKILGRLWPVLATSMAISISVAVAYLATTLPQYTSTGTILLDPRRTVTIGSDSANNTPQLTLDNAQAESQLQVIRSERLLTNVFSALNLQDTRELNPRKFNLKEYLTSIVMRETQDDLPDPSLKTPNTKGAAFQNFVSRVSARRVGLSYVIEVTYTSSDATTARKLSNAIMSAYLGQQISYKLAAAQNGAEYLQGRVNSLNAQLKAANVAVINGLVPDNYMPDADARIISAAAEPLGKAWPKSGLIIAASLAFGAIAGGFSMIVYNSVDNRVWSENQLLSIDGVKIISLYDSKPGNFSKRKNSRFALRGAGGFSAEFQAIENINALKKRGLLWLRLK